MAIAVCLLVAGVVAFAAVPVFEESRAPTPPKATASVEPPVIEAPPRSPPPPASVEPPVIEPPREPPLSRKAAGRALRSALRHGDWATAADACAHLLGRTSSRRLRVACAIASCRADRLPLHDAFVDGLSPSRRKRVARECASADPS
jgi:hypothetical protein